MIRVLIVDDSVVVRNRLNKILSADLDIEVVGVAASGQIALAKLAQVNPDLIILDVEMPDMDGLETLAAIRQRDRTLPIIMFSALTHLGAVATIEALSLGASDYATKPSQSESIEAANQHIQTALIPKIKALAIQNNLAPAPKLPSAIAQNQPIEIVAIAASTGGPNALSVLLSQLPAHFPVPIVIAQHMPPLFTKLLAERLTAKCQVKVEEAHSGALLSPGTVWIAPGDYHLVVSKGKVMTHQESPENFCRPSADVLLRSVAQTYGARSLAVILTGMGQDGLRGCEWIRDRGGQIMTQDQASSVVWGMPGFVANAGLADAVLPLEDLAGEILRRVNRTQVKGV
jgi:two-component system, chemotaxis family, protein-glutamate methylesterase/glutaminase